MPYGTIKVDNVIYTKGGVDTTITVSGIVDSLSGAISVTGAISGASVSATTGTFTTLSGNTTAGTTATFTSGIFTTFSGTTVNVVSGVFATVATTGLVSTGTGTAGAPTITFTGDTNTGIYSPGADQVAISTNGSGRLFIDSSGRVGVGTSTVNSIFEVRGTTNNQDIIHISNSAGTFATDGSATNRIRNTCNGNSNWANLDIQAFQTIFTQNGTERARIDSSGRLGLGTSSPGERLAVNGNATIGDTSQPVFYLRSTTNSGSSTVLSSIDSYSTPYSATNARIAFRGGYVGYADLGAISFQTKGFDGLNDRVFITSTGLVGIGTTSPTELLHINGNMQVGWGTYRVASVFDNSYRQGLAFDSANRQLRVFSTTNDSGGSIGFYTRVGSGSSDTDYGTERARIDSSGRLLVGTSSTSANSTITCQGHSGVSTGEAWLRLNRGVTTPSSGDTLGALIFGDSTACDAAYVYAQRDGGTWSGSSKPTRLVFSTTADGAASPTPRMTITSGGNVQIGNTSNDAKLEVVAAAAPGGGNFIGRFLNTYSGDVSNAGLYIGKYDNNSTTSQLLIKFSINNDTAGQGQINANGASQAAFGTFSDRRLKENINDLSSQWDSIKSLRPVEFDYIESEGGGHQIGFIAQDVQAIYPDVVGEREDGMLTLSGMGKNESRLIKALQEAMERIEKLEADVAALKA